MKNLILFMLFVVMLVLVQYVQAQTQNADEIVDKNLQARGGKENIMAIKSVVMEGMRQAMGNEVEFVVTKVQGKLSRTDFTFAGNAGYMILTESAGWQFIPMRSTSAEAIPEERVKNMQTELDIAGPLVDYKAKGHKVELAGKDAVNGNDAHKLKVTLNSGKEVIYFIDMKSFQIVRTSSKIPGRNGEVTEQVTDFSDFKTVDKVVFPHTINVLGTGMMAGSSTFDKILLNKEVSEKLYAPEG